MPIRLFLSLMALPACSLPRTPLGGGPDAPGLDAPRPDVPGLDAAPLDTPGCDPTACDDDEPCTDDGCGAAGCEHVPNTAPCDDGLFCTTGETCASGTCGGGTASCPSCDESIDSCGTCGGAGDCPGGGMPIPGTCSFADACSEAGSRSVSTWDCVAGSCVENVTSEPCTRSTDGVACGMPTTTPGPCVGAGGCSTSGVRSVDTDTPTCLSGACTPVRTTTSEACTYDPTGAACEECMPPSGCVPASMAGCRGQITQSCTAGTCDSGGACVAAGVPELRTMDCDLPASTACAEASCGPCVRDPPRCSMTCTMLTGRCDGAGTCTGSSSSMTVTCTGC